MVFAAPPIRIQMLSNFKSNTPPRFRRRCPWLFVTLTSLVGMSVSYGDSPEMVADLSLTQAGLRPLDGQSPEANPTGTVVLAESASSAISSAPEPLPPVVPPDLAANTPQPLTAAPGPLSDSIVLNAARDRERDGQSHQPPRRATCDQARRRGQVDPAGERRSGERASATRRTCSR
jgi:hypothetical protein